MYIVLESAITSRHTVAHFAIFQYYEKLRSKMSDINRKVLCGEAYVYGS
jgi:hypothetical protein